MKVFVSYSRKDGLVTSEMLRFLYAHLQSVCKPFIHCLCESESIWEQARVVFALLTSNVVLLVESPATSSSRWVKLELYLTRLIGLPIIRLKANDLAEVYNAK